MPRALFSFDDPAAAKRAMRRLAEAGISGHAVHLHVHGDPEAGTLAADVDEVVTGGIARSFKTLWDGVFDWPQSRQELEAFLGTVERGGAVVSVNAGTAAERTQTDTVMDNAPAVKKSGWGPRDGSQSP